MWWIFVREFYRAGQTQSAIPSPAKVIETPAPAISRVRSPELSAEDNARVGQKFLASMSHELRTPLNAIMGFSDMMRQQTYGELGHPNYREYAEHIYEAGEYLLAKVNGLLNLAALDSGKLELTESPVEMQDLLAELSDLYAHAASCRQVTLSMDAPTRVTLTADRRLLLAALSHFIENALRHSLAGGKIQLTMRPQGHEGMVIAVRDYGKGMPEAQLQAIRRALAVDASYFEVEGDSIGLGLALAKELIGKHDGSVSIESMRGQGTVVSMFIPASRILSGLIIKKPRLQVV